MSDSIITLDNICSVDVLQASPEASIATILQRMRRAQVSSTVIVEQNRPVGIITERDVLQFISTPPDNLLALPARKLMSTPVVALAAHTDYQIAYQALQDHQIRHIIVVNDDGSVRGIASETDFVQHIGIEYLTEIHCVEAVMTPDIRYIDGQASLRHAFTIMSEQQIGCLVVGAAESIEGILTERDAVRYLEKSLDIDTTPVCDCMSTPVNTLPVDTSLIVARQRMQERGIRRLVITDQAGHAVGIVTRKNLISRLQNYFIRTMREAIGALTQQLQQSQDQELHYRGFFENAPLAYQSMDADGRLIEVNNRWREITGYAQEEVIGQRFTTLLDDASATAFEHCYDAFRNSHEIGQLNCQLITKQGQMLNIQLDGRVIRDHQGQFLKTHCLMSNLTQQRQVDSQLRVFRTLIDSSNDALYVIDADNARILDINQAAVDMLGYSRDTLLQMTVIDISALYHTLKEWHDKVDYIRHRNSRQLFEGVQTRLDGSQLPVEISSRLLTLNGQELIVSTVRDISDRKAAEQRSQDEKRFLQAVIDCIGDPVTVLDTDYQVITANKAAREEYVTQPGAPCGMNDIQHCHRAIGHSRCDQTHAHCPLQTVMLQKRSTTAVHENTNRHGQKRTIELKASPLYDAEGNLSGIVEAARDITDHIRIQKQLQEKEKSLDHLAHHDPLTGLPNRLLFTDRLNQAIRCSQRTRQIMALLFLDLDEFKVINDSYGHALGDRLLKQVSVRLKEALRANDTIARLGGDEFTVISDGLERPEDAALIAQNLIDTINRPFIINNQRLHISLSIGISLYPTDCDNADALLRNADTAMYRAKAAGKNRYEFYTQDMTDQAFERIQILSALRNALDKGQFELHFQPQIDLRNQRIIGAEALLRWHDPQLGLIEPTRFIPIAEKAGLIDKIDVWVLNRVCQYIRQWLAEGYDVPRISVNISARHFGNNSIASEIREILHTHGCSSNMIELELTESVILNNPGHAGYEFQQLRDMGIHLAIDDFGTGYSSLNYLKKLPLDRLKIDRSFISEIPHNHNDQAISRAVIALGRSLGISVIAEGMETDAQQQFLLAEGCHYAQGHYFSSALPEARFLALLETQLTTHDLTD